MQFFLIFLMTLVFGQALAEQVLVKTGQDLVLPCHAPEPTTFASWKNLKTGLTVLSRNFDPSAEKTMMPTSKRYSFNMTQTLKTTDISVLIQQARNEDAGTWVCGCSSCGRREYFDIVVTGSDQIVSPDLIDWSLSSGYVQCMLFNIFACCFFGFVWSKTKWTFLFISGVVACVVSALTIYMVYYVVAFGMVLLGSHMYVYLFLMGCFGLVTGLVLAALILYWESKKDLIEKHIC